MKRFFSILVFFFMASPVFAQEARTKDGVSLIASENNKESRPAVQKELSEKEKAVLTKTKYIKSYFEVMEGLRSRSTIGGRRNQETTFPEHSLIAIGSFLEGNCLIFQRCGIELIEYCDMPSATLMHVMGEKLLAMLSELDTNQVNCAREERGITRSVTKHFELLTGGDLLALQREVAKINSLDISQETKRVLLIGLLEDNRLYWQAMKLTNCLVESANNNECEEGGMIKQIN